MDATFYSLGTCIDLYSDGTEIIHENVNVNSLNIHLFDLSYSPSLVKLPYNVEAVRYIKHDQIIKDVYGPIGW